MMTIDELGRKFKRKHPNAYDHLSDEEVGRRALKKYPGYVNNVSDSDMFDDPVSSLTKNLPEIDIDPKLAENLQPLLEYYNPERGIFTAWWQRRKSTGRTSLLKQVSEEYIEVIKQGALLEQEISNRRKGVIEFRMFIVQNVALLIKLKTEMQLTQAASEEGMTLPHYSESNYQERLAKIRQQEEEARAERERKAEEERIVRNLQAAKQYKRNEDEITNDLRIELQNALISLDQTEARTDISGRTKTELMTSKQNQIDNLKFRIAAREKRAQTDEESYL